MKFTSLVLATLGLATAVSSYAANASQPLTKLDSSAPPFMLVDLWTTAPGTLTVQVQGSDGKPLNSTPVSASNPAGIVSWPGGADPVVALMYTYNKVSTSVTISSGNLRCTNSGKGGQVLQLDLALNAKSVPVASAVCKTVPQCPATADMVGGSRYCIQQSKS